MRTTQSDVTSMGSQNLTQIRRTIKYSPTAQSKSELTDALP